MTPLVWRAINWINWRTDIQHTLIAQSGLRFLSDQPKKWRKKKSVLYVNSSCGQNPRRHIGHQPSHDRGKPWPLSPEESKRAEKHAEQYPVREHQHRGEQHPRDAAPGRSAAVTITTVTGRAVSQSRGAQCFRDTYVHRDLCMGGALGALAPEES